MSKVIVVAFDGMSKSLIKEFGLKNIPQEEFGDIDNDTGISQRMTSELFASFITGETQEEHGVTGLSTSLGWKDKFLKYIFPRWVLDRIPGAFRLRSILSSVDTFDPRKYTKSDLNTDTLFEEIDAALPLYIPSYNPDPVWLTGFPHGITRNFTEKEWEEITEWHTEARLREGIGNQPAFFDVSKDFWDFVMLHLHDPDSFQDTELGDLEKQYKRLDKIAGEIKEKYSEWTIIFLSDHGKPVKGEKPRQHSRDAFYSCNRKLFGNEQPHITQFHDKILELTKK